MDTLLTSCKTATTQEAFAAAYQQLVEAFLDEMPVIPLLMGMDALMLNSNVQGMETPAANSVFANMAGWYIAVQQGS